MNKVILLGRLTKDPDVRATGADENATTIARYTLAINRKSADGEDADFVNCTAFGKSADFAGKYLVKGMRVAVVGKIRTGSYTNKEGQKVYTNEVVIDEQEFAESKSEKTEWKSTRKPDYDVNEGFLDPVR